MLLEVLSDFQISIPELGRVEARTHPIVLLTSNNSRELTEALKRRCLYLWLDYPELEHELAIVACTRPSCDDAIARKLVEVIGMVRELDLKKPPSIAESIDWARALLLLGAEDIDAETFTETMSVIVKHRTDIDVVAERVGLKLGPCRVAGSRCRARRRDRAGGARPAPARASARSCAARASRSARPSCSTPSRSLGEVRWTAPEDFREALAATLAKSQEDRRVFELVFDRFFFRAAELAAVARGRRARASGVDAGRARRARPRDAARADRARRCATATRARMRDLARMAIAAFGAPGRGLGRDRRRRPAHPPRARPARRAAARPGRGRPAPRRPPARRDLRRFEALLRRELERAQIERTEHLPPARPLNELDRALPSGPLAGPRRRAPRRRPAQAPPGDAGPAEPRAQAPRARRRAPDDARVAADRRRPGRPQVPPGPPAAAGDLRAVRRLDVASPSARVFFLSVLHALHDSFRKMRSFVFIERISEVTDVFERERDFKAVSDAISRDAGVADISRLHRLRPRVVGVRSRWSRTTCTRARR